MVVKVSQIIDVLNVFHFHLRGTEYFFARATFPISACHNHILPLCAPWKIKLLKPYH